MSKAKRVCDRTWSPVSLRQNLVGVQVAVSCLLLISSSVLAHKGIASAAVNVAFDYRNMIVIDPQLYARNLPAPIVREKLDALTARLKALPGVQGVTAAVAPPLGGRVLIESLPGLPRIYRDAVAPSYFSVMQLPIVRGRTFYEGERNAVIVSASAARAIWPDGDVVGKIWKFGGASRTVTGIAKDSGANLIGDPDSIEAYTPIDGPDVERSALIVHSRTDPGLFTRMLPATRQEAVSVSLMRAIRDNFIEGQNKFITLIGSVGALATVLAAAGMFALVGFAVAQRKRELGIRIAIGAKRHHILETLLLQKRHANYRRRHCGSDFGCHFFACTAQLHSSSKRRRSGCHRLRRRTRFLHSRGGVGDPNAGHARVTDRSVRNAARGTEIRTSE